MNKNCAKLNLRATFLDSPHGLLNRVSRSTAFDIAKLSAFCLEDPRFLKIVQTKLYKVRKTKENGNSQTYVWENTHRMAGQKGITAIKTGVTQSAGPCLATASEMSPDCKLIIVLIACKDMDCRWIETLKLAKWATHRLCKIKQYSRAASLNNDS